KIIDNLNTVWPSIIVLGKKVAFNSSLEKLLIRFKIVIPVALYGQSTHIKDMQWCVHLLYDVFPRKDSTTNKFVFPCVKGTRESTRFSPNEDS
ncbi:hypothetical protein AVEN_125394-1, partial [Araneus ventricosus]